MAVTIGGTAVPVTSVRVSNSLDSAGATCRMGLELNPAALTLEGGPQPLVAALGYGGTNAAAFTGTTQSDAPATWPMTDEVTAFGKLAALTRGAARGAVFQSLYDQGGWTTNGLYETFVVGTGEITSPVTDGDIATALMTSAGLVSGDYSLQYAVPIRALASRTPLVLGRKAGEMLSILRRIDLLTGFWTADQASGVISRRPDPRAAAAYGSPLGTFAEGPRIGGERPIISPVQRPRSLDTVTNAQLVLGYVYPDSDPWAAVYYNRPNAAYTAFSALVGGGSVVRWAQPFEDNLIETTADADTVCQMLMRRRNKLQNTVNMIVPGDATLDVGQVWNVRAPSIGLSSATPHVVVAVDHEWLPASATTRLTLEGLTGDVGTAINPVPTADFSLSLSGTTATMDATAQVTSLITDGPFGYRWFSDASGVTKSGSPQAVLVFRPEEFPALVFLEAEDSGSRLRTFTSKAAA